MEDDLVVQGRLDLDAPARSATPLSSASTSRNARTCTFRPNLISRALRGSRTFSSCTSSSLSEREKICGQRDVLLRVEVVREVLIASGPARRAQCAARSRCGRRRRGRSGRPRTTIPLRALVFQQDEIVVAKGDQAFVACQALQQDIRGAVGAEGQRFQRRLRRAGKPPCRISSEALSW